MPRPEVPDTTVFIQFLHQSRGELRLQRSMASGNFWLSSVVVGELYAGTRSRDDARTLDRYVAAMNRVERILIPTAEDWAHAGQLIARRIRLAGDVRPRDHIADVLILVSAARLNGLVVTANRRHFETWARLARRAGMDVEIDGLQE